MDFGMFCLSYGFADVIRRPLVVALVIASLSIAGFYAYQNVVLEFYYSWPYAQMGADVFVSANIEEADDVGGDLFQKLEDSGALVTDYRVVIEHEGVAEDIVLHAIAGRSLPFADATVFNYESMHSDLTEGSVWVDDGLASRLGVNVSDEIHVVQRVSGVDAVLQVTAIVPSFAPTNGIVVAGIQDGSMKPFSISIYAENDRLILPAVEQLESLGVPTSLQYREDAYQSAMILAQELLPFASSDALQIAAVVFAFVSFLIFSVVTARRQFARFFDLLVLMGARVRTVVAIVAIELFAIAMVAAAVSGVVAVVALDCICGIPVTGMFVLSTIALLALGSVLAVTGTLCFQLIRLGSQRLYGICGV